MRKCQQKHNNNNDENNGITINAINKRNLYVK